MPDDPPRRPRARSMPNIKAEGALEPRRLRAPDDDRRRLAMFPTGRTPEERFEDLEGAMVDVVAEQLEARQEREEIKAEQRAAKERDATNMEAFKAYGKAVFGQLSTLESNDKRQDDKLNQQTAILQTLESNGKTLKEKVEKQDEVLDKQTKILERLADSSLDARARFWIVMVALVGCIALVAMGLLRHQETATILGVPGAIGAFVYLVLSGRKKPPSDG